MPRSSARLRRLVVVAAFAGLAVPIAQSSAGPAYADDVWGAGKDGPSTVQVHGDHTGTHTGHGSPSGPLGPFTGTSGTHVPTPAEVAQAAACVGAAAGAVVSAAGLDLVGAVVGAAAVGTECGSQPNAAPGTPATPVITTEMVSQAASVTAPRNPPHVEPGHDSLVNIPNNYWTDTEPVADEITVLGVRIPMHWTPTSTTWDFGDGATATGNGVRGADVGTPGTVEHAYDRRGSYAITTSTSYDLTFRLPGHGPQTIHLTAPPSPAVTLPVRELQTRTDYAD
jgi:hypothetical protein